MPVDLREHIRLVRPARIAPLFTLLLAGCGGSTPPAASPTNGGTAEAAQAQCSEHGSTKAYDLHDSDGDAHGVPCSKSGKHDLGGLVRIDTVNDGIRITIEATDDDFNEGAFGSDLKGRDAVIVRPRGPNSPPVEVPLVKTAAGYRGEKTILFEDLDKLTDEGTKVEVSIFDHDDDHADGKHEELKLTVAVSAGKSCEKAMDENPQEVTMGAKDAPDLSDNQLAGPVKTSSFFSNCALSDSANAELCVAVKQGKPIGVTVSVSPKNNRVATCIDKATRRLNWPASKKLDVVHQKF
jgi:hypothetical protein